MVFDNDQLQHKVEALEAQATIMQKTLQEVVTLNDIISKTLTKALERIVGLEQKFNKNHITDTLTRISKIHPKTNSVVFVGRNHFGGNQKYTFLAFAALARKKGIPCHFLTDDPLQHALLTSLQLPCLLLSNGSATNEQIEILLQAKIAVLTDNFHPQSSGGPITHALLQGAKQIQLWHGIPLKEIGLGSLCDPEIMAACGPLEVLTVTNASSRDDWSKRFTFREFAPTGYPRNDVLLRKASSTDLINVDTDSLACMQVARQNGKPVILYAPTFRDHAGPEWLKAIDLNRFAAYCQARGYAFFVNLHPTEQKALSTLQQHFSNVAFIAPGTDIYPIVAQTDILITDYSSLAFDYLLLDRPILFFRPDHNDYVSKSRPLIKGREHYTPGPILDQMDNLIAATDTAALSLQQTKDPYQKQRQALRDELFDHPDGNSTQRVCDLILRHLETPAAL